mmetsp:Transcript_10696/g.21700  ORF Transcript_10696/g.21700 Transcript_10696/m.21700 type:complete len:206 (-) Transcript_10696:289-906(-)
MMSHSASTIFWYAAMSVMRTSALSRSALSSSSTLSKQTLGLSKTLVICSKPAYEKHFLKATPSTRTDSWSAPPCTFFMPIISRLGAASSRDSTASTTILAKKSLCPETSLEFRDVAADFSSMSRRLAASLASRWTASSSSFSIASLLAVRNAFTIVCGCTPSSMYGLHSRRNSPARSTTLVVPSPTSASCDMEICTRVTAAGCTI